MKNRTKLFDFKQRMRKNIWSGDEYDLLMIAEWLLEIDDRLEKLEKTEEIEVDHEVVQKYKEACDLLSELTDLIEDHLRGKYNIDSFTLQTAQDFLAKNVEKDEEEENENR